MIATPELLRRRKRLLTAKIALQRVQLERELGALRGPLQAFAVARGVGEALMRHAGLVGIVAAFAGILLLRGGLLARARRALHFAARTARWWVLARLGWQRLR
jgi:hypothetical protein